MESKNGKVWMKGLGQEDVGLKIKGRRMKLKALGGERAPTYDQGTEELTSVSPGTEIIFPIN